MYLLLSIADGACILEVKLAFALLDIVSELLVRFVMFDVGIRVVFVEFLLAVLIELSAVFNFSPHVSVAVSCHWA